MHERKLARDAGSGRFISRDRAHRRPKTTVVETVRVPVRRRLRATGGPVTEENQNEQPCKGRPNR